MCKICKMEVVRRKKKNSNIYFWNRSIYKILTMFLKCSNSFPKYILQVATKATPLFLSPSCGPIRSTNTLLLSWLPFSLRKYSRHCARCDLLLTSSVDVRWAPPFCPFAFLLSQKEKKRKGVSKLSSVMQAGWTSARL